MEIIARRFTIITLTAMIFAMAFSAAVDHAGQGSHRLRGGLTTSCTSATSVTCHSLL